MITTTARPVLALDVDGPLNPFAAKATRRPPGYTTLRFPVPPGTPRKPLRVWLNPDHGALLLRLADSFDLVWATSWQHHANTCIAPALGLPTALPVIDFPGEGERRWALDGWKWNAVAAYAGGRPLAWIDDEFHSPWNGEARDRFLTDRGGASTLLHHVDPRVGLTAADTTTLLDWATALKEHP